MLRQDAEDAASPEFLRFHLSSTFLLFPSPLFSGMCLECRKSRIFTLFSEYFTSHIRREKHSGLLFYKIHLISQNKKKRNQKLLAEMAILHS